MPLKIDKSLGFCHPERERRIYRLYASRRLDASLRSSMTSKINTLSLLILLQTRPDNRRARGL
jgi:hypothetical protein